MCPVPGGASPAHTRAAATLETPSPPQAGSLISRARWICRPGGSRLAALSPCRATSPTTSLLRRGVNLGGRWVFPPPPPVTPQKPQQRRAAGHILFFLL